MHAGVLLPLGGSGSTTTGPSFYRAVPRRVPNSKRNSKQRWHENSASPSIIPIFDPQIPIRRKKLGTHFSSEADLFANHRCVCLSPQRFKAMPSFEWATRAPRSL